MPLGLERMLEIRWAASSNWVERYATSYVGAPFVWELVYEFDPKDGTEKVGHEFNGDDGERPIASLLSAAGR